MRWVALAVALLAACHVSPQVALATENTNEIPFKLYRDYAIMVRGSIGNLKNLNFLVDTGAVPSVLDERTARQLRMEMQDGQLSVFTKKLSEPTRNRAGGSTGTTASSEFTCGRAGLVFC